MGVIIQGILGGFSGKVANVVGSSWKGIAVLKSLPLSVANPKTAGQQAQRGAMSQIVSASRLLLASLIQPFWNPFAQKMSGYNAFVKENIDTFLTAGFTDFANFFSTRGSLLNVVVSSATADASDNAVIVNWTDNTGSADALATDEAVIVYYNATKNTWSVDTGNAVRSDGTITIADTSIDASDELKVYTSMARPDVSKVADSVYNAVTVSA